MSCSQLLATLPLPVTALLALTAAPTLAQPPTSSVSQFPRAEVRAIAKTIDQLVEADLAAREQRPNRRTDDPTFVRRIYLDVLGRIPSAAEARAFLDSQASDRRAALIDQLLDSPGSTSHTFNYFADLFRAKTRLARQTSGEPYIHWLKDAITQNTPYDLLVTELLTASGPAHARDNGATGYFLRDRGMPEDNMANTARVFLGTRLECAQCHNHPFDKWTQKQFYEMTAFTGGMRYQDKSSSQSEHARRLIQLGRQLRRENPRAAQVLRRMNRSYTNGISGSGSGLMRLPKEYQYDDAKPLQLVAAHTAFGADAELDVVVPKPKQRQRNRGGGRRRPTPPKRRNRRGDNLPELDSRAAYANWMTSPENPRFTLVIANRMWKRVMGRGLIEPVDNITDATQPSNPTLMDHLEFTMLDLGYDLKQFQRVLFNTEAYQRTASKHTPGAAEIYRFPGPLLRRMTAEQMWDSVLNLVTGDVDSTLTAPGQQAERVYIAFEQLSNLTEDELMARVDRESLRYTDPQRYRAMQRRARMESDAPARAARAARKLELRQLRRQLGQARRERDQEKTAKLRARIEELSQQNRRGGRGLRRASDLPSPAPAGHFLRQFGQSDREQIGAANREANVPQVLTLLNGFIEQRVMQRNSAVMRDLDATKTPTAAIQAAYLATLNRAPSSSEVRLWRRDVERGGEAAVRDLLWSLLNTQEFRFVQ